jgi:hypothetical protein
MQENDISMEYNCNNRLERSMRMVHMEKGCALGAEDGYPFYFFSEGVGATMPPMVLQQILCLSHLLHHPVKPEHMASNELYVTKFWNTEPKTLEHVLKRVPMDVETDNTRVYNVNDLRGKSIRDVSVGSYCNFAQNEENEYTLSAVPNAQIFCGPVIVAYTDEKSGKPMNKCVWAVVYKPIRVYDVASHLRSFMHTLQNGKKDTVLGEQMEEVYGLWQDVLRYQLSKSPSATRFYDDNTAAGMDPTLGLMEHGAPYSLIACCNVFEFYRSIVAYATGAGIFIHSRSRSRMVWMCRLSSATWEYSTGTESAIPNASVKNS